MALSPEPAAMQLKPTVATQQCGLSVARYSDFPRKLECLDLGLEPLSFNILAYSVKNFTGPTFWTTTLNFMV